MIPSRSWLMVGTPTPLKNHGVQVRLDDDIPNDIGVPITKCLPNHQHLQIIQCSNFPTNLWIIYIHDGFMMDYS